jgi:glucose-1-phosphate adenylyltransferase
MGTDRVLAMVLAGGEGTRRAPPTAVRSKPAVPFGARYRIVDFVLSNLVNSEIYAIHVLVQFRGTADAVYQNLTEGGVVVVPMAPVRPDANRYE